MSLSSGKAAVMTRSALFEPWSLGNIVVPNRIVMAPMSSNRADKSGRPTPSLIDYLKRRARGGCGLIICESATVDAVAGSAGRTLRIDSGSCVEPLGALVKELRLHSSLVAAQLWHAGPRAIVANGLPLSPSGTTADFPESRPLDISEIQQIIQSFVEAGDRAARAGFDVIEIHAAHGYLLHHFVDRITNRRRDAYGGSVAKRFRILAEIRRGLQKAHPNLPVILRLSLRSDDDFKAIGGAVREAGFQAVDVRTGFSSAPKTQEGASVAAGYTLELARALRDHVRIPLMTGGRILNPAQAEQAIKESGLTAVVLGRALLADPDWALKAASAQSIVPCVYDCVPSCYSKFKEGEELRCVYYESPD